jgi:RNA polymerase sigma-B factor
MQDNTSLLWKYYYERLNNPPAIRLRNIIVQTNIGLVRQQAHRMVPLCNEPFDDLVQIGCLGLVKAVERFDPRQNLKLSTLAARWIRGEILHYLRDKGATVRIPNSFRELYAKARRYQAKRNFVEYIQAREIASHLGITKDEWDEIKFAIEQQQCRELSEFFDYSEEGIFETTHLRVDVEHPEDEVEEQLEIYVKEIYAALNRISEPGKTTIYLLFQKQYTKKRVAQYFNISPRIVDSYIQTALQELTEQINGTNKTNCQCDTQCTA